MPTDSIIPYILYTLIVIATVIVLKSPKDKGDKKENDKKDDN